MPGSNCLPLAGSEAKFLRRAAFLQHNLWVTQYNKDEQYPGGEFPNQNPRVGEGLHTWADVVLWLVIVFIVSIFSMMKYFYILLAVFYVLTFVFAILIL